MLKADDNLSVTCPNISEDMRESISETKAVLCRRTVHVDPRNRQHLKLSY